MSARQPPRPDHLRERLGLRHPFGRAADAIEREPADVHRTVDVAGCVILVGTRIDNSHCWVVDAFGEPVGVRQ
ncbi:MAG TPA: hypothetical protein QGI71_05225 [Dehalococcoidia bacterium]|nr:hypothetical protein [Dehalococcoidia bacterium]